MIALYGAAAAPTESWLANNLVQAGLIILAFVLLQMVIRRYIKNLIGGIIRTHHYTSKAEEEQREESIASILRTASTVILTIIALFAVLSVFEVNFSGLLTGAGLVGIIIGFGAQSTIKDFLGGIFIILENQYRVGDIVTLHGSSDVSGVVESLTIRVTKLRDLDGYQHTVQNGDIHTVTNMSIGFANVNVDVQVAYDSSITQVEQVINKVGKELAEHKDWKDRIEEPIAFLRVDDFAESGMVIKALGKVLPAAQWDVAGEFRRRVKHAFDQEHIEIPFPQRVVHEIVEKSVKRSTSRS